jgi:hypothetical protein
MVLAEFLCAREIFRLSVVIPSFGKAARRKRVVLRQVKQSIMNAFACVVPEIQPDVLFAALQRNHAVVSGSVVLRALDPHVLWHARDLDIFVPSSRCAKRVVRFLATLGRLYSPKPWAYRLQNYPGALQVHDVLLRQKPGSRPALAVQAIVVKDVQEHVAGVDLAFLRNWCDVVVGDVSAVCKRRSAVTRWPTGRPHKFLRWLDTYSRRGYSFSNLSMVPRTVEVPGLAPGTTVIVYLMVHDSRCVGVFFRKDSLHRNLLELAGEDASLRAALLRAFSHVRPVFVKPVFRDFSFVTDVSSYFLVGTDPEPLMTRLREIKSVFLYMCFPGCDLGLYEITRLVFGLEPAELSVPDASKRISRSFLQSSSTSSASLHRA